jgi:hypothetical protein
MMTRIGMMQVEKLIRVVTLQLPARIRHREIKNSEIFGSYSWNSLWGNKYPYCADVGPQGGHGHLYFKTPAGAFLMLEWSFGSCKIAAGHRSGY